MVEITEADLLSLDRLIGRLEAVANTDPQHDTRLYAENAAGVATFLRSHLRIVHRAQKEFTTTIARLRESEGKESDK